MINNQFGFKQSDLVEIIRALSEFSDLDKAVIFGSRAKGNFKEGSDVDIAIWTLNDKILGKVDAALNDETWLPYQFDVLDYGRINNEDLKMHIERVGIEIYNKHFAMNL